MRSSTPSSRHASPNSTASVAVRDVSVAPSRPADVGRWRKLLLSACRIQCLPNSVPAEYGVHGDRVVYRSDAHLVPGEAESGPADLDLRAEENLVGGGDGDPGREA